MISMVMQRITTLLKRKPPAPKQIIILDGYTYSGATWIMNVLLELGIRSESTRQPLFVHEKSIDNQYSEYKLHQDNSISSKCCLPSLVFKEKFIFRNDVMCSYTDHHFIHSKDDDYSQAIISVRDPRDALWSQYNANVTHLSFDEFVREQHQADAWKHFYDQCFKLPNIIFLKFEDAKADPILQIKNIMKFCNLTFSEYDIISAANNSTSDRGKAAEQLHRSTTPSEKIVFKKTFYRSGAVQQWKNLPEHEKTFAHIKNVAHQTMKVFGYE